MNPADAGPRSPPALSCNLRRWNYRTTLLPSVQCPLECPWQRPLKCRQNWRVLCAPNWEVSTLYKNIILCLWSTPTLCKTSRIRRAAVLFETGPRGFWWLINSCVSVPRSFVPWIYSLMAATTHSLLSLCASIPEPKVLILPSLELFIKSTSSTYASRCSY